MNTFQPENGLKIKIEKIEKYIGYRQNVCDYIYMYTHVYYKERMGNVGGTYIFEERWCTFVYYKIYDISFSWEITFFLSYEYTAQCPR